MIVRYKSKHNPKCLNKCLNGKIQLLFLLTKWNYTLLNELFFSCFMNVNFSGKIRIKKGKNKEKYV